MNPHVFAVEDTTAQLVWATLPRGEHAVEVGGSLVTVVGDGGPVATVVEGLPPDRELDVVVDGRRSGSLRTLASLPGPELCRVVTVSDLHVGDGHTFGILPQVRDRARTEESVNVRCARAALREAAAWDPRLLVAKGDITHHGHVEEWAGAAGILTEPALPVMATIGNHDVRPGHVDGRPTFDAAGIELVVGGVGVRDLPGLRVIVADVTLTGRHPGSYRAVGDALLEAAAGTAGPVLVAQHHQLQRLPVPTHWPPGVLGPGSGRFLRALGEANPRAVVTSGHTHRNRARRVGPVLVTEVGSPKDHPGTWAGYAVHEGGIRQVVRRTMDPDVLRWTQRTGRALFGIWGRWSPGRLEDRCVSQAWDGSTT